jgi:hypothetical protein
VQIFDMDRRDRAQHRQRLVEQQPIGSRCGHQRHGRCPHIGNHAEGVAQIELARLRGNVAGRVMQAQEAVDAMAHGFGHHFARFLRIEAIDHDAVETGDRAHLPRAFAQERGQAVHLLQPRDHAAHHRSRLDGSTAAGSASITISRPAKCTATSNGGRPASSGTERCALRRPGRAGGQPIADGVDGFALEQVDSGCPSAPRTAR